MTKTIIRPAQNISFNRYMVECEYVFKERAALERRSFNRYMVECESVKKIRIFRIKIVLIDTWWNVNLQGLFLMLVGAF